LWLGHCKRASLEDRCENMTNLVTQLWFKQKVFLSLKLATMERQGEREVEKFKAWKSWCEQARKDKYHDKKELMVEKIFGTRTE